MNDDTKRIIESVGAKVRKEIVADQRHTILVIQLDDSFESLEDADILRVQQRVEAILPGIVPRGVAVTAVLNGGVYQREVFSDGYEYEIVAADEAALAARMERFFSPRPKGD